MSNADWFCTGDLDALPIDTRRALLQRADDSGRAVRSAVTEIIEAVRRDGDAAVRACTARYDRVDVARAEVDPARVRRAADTLEPRVRSALERAAANIAEVHRAFLPSPIELVTRDGVTIGRRPDPLDCVGVYAPGGRAAYPSSVLMGVVPARVAGVREVIVCSPPGPDGAPSDVVLAAAALGGADRVFSIGGAAAIAAMAFGTQTVPRVDRIVGPGNAYVAAAKLLVADAVGIDSPAGPSELLVIADAHANPSVIAREVLAQAEHDPLAAVVVLATDDAWADALARAVRAACAAEPRAHIITQALRARGAVLVARDVASALRFASEYAPEHLLLAVADARAWLGSARNAGTVFLGETSSVTFGDYLTGANHVLPTGGLARTYSGLSTHDFMRWTTYQHVDARAARALASDVDVLARAEQLPAHAAAARQWVGDGA